MVLHVSDATSLNDAESLDWNVRKLDRVVGMLIGKADVAVKLFFSLYQLAMSVEEHGLLILPEN